MKRINLIVLLSFLFVGLISAQGEEKTVIKIETDNIDLIYRTGPNGRLYQSYIGQSLQYDRDIESLPLGTEAYFTHGMEDYFEPAIRILHNDGNPSLLLKYVSHAKKQTEPNITETVITLQDDKYPVTVKLFFVSFTKENIIKTYTEISHQEKKPVILYNYASSMLHLNSNKYFLTEFAGDWAHEVNMTERQLDFGKKIVDTKLGSRANMFCSPMFLLSLDKEAEENTGEVLFGTINWTGNFRFTFEVDQLNKLRIISGINPYATEYSLPPNEIFRTPEFVFTYSSQGKGKASRDIHRWALKHQIKDGRKSRMTLLNNWEATYFDFDENKLVSIMDEAVKLDVDMFLLDDGWFANKYPRSSDRQGLGDWQETVSKLPNGLGKLVKEATDKGIKFGVWIEPEMVNPKSELYEKHKDWVIHLPNRDEYYFRNQMVLDLSNPKVQDHVFGVVDNIMTKYPGIAYFKWDCNSPITNIYSPYLKDKQSHLYIEYVRGLYNVLERIKAKYPNLPMMLCSGGGGRSDYEALKYFTEFWPSDNTDPVERIFIQWGFGHFFPAKSMAAHVTSWGKQPIKFRTDVAMMCKLGFDIRINEMNDAEQEYCRNAVKNFKRLENVILDGDLYRLVSPYETDHAVVMYVNENRSKSVVFAFDIHPRYAENVKPVRLEGLDPAARYEVKEINQMPGTGGNQSSYVFSGDFLMKAGLDILSSRHTSSRILELTKVD